MGGFGERSCIGMGGVLMMSVGKIHWCLVIEEAPVVNFHKLSQVEGHDLPVKCSEGVCHG